MKASAQSLRRSLIVIGCIAPALAAAQQPVPSQPPSAPPQQQFQSSQEWAKLPKMTLERQFAGPLQDTVIQRLRDPVDGTVCYVYLPISVAHTPPTASGFVQYGPNGVGSINCLPPPAAGRVPPSAAKRQ